MIKKWTQKYGDFYGFYEGTTPTIVTCDLDVVQKVFITDYNIYDHRIVSLLEHPTIKRLNELKFYHLSKMLLAMAHNIYKS